MIRRWLLTFLFLVGFCGSAVSVWGAVEAGGTITADTTWTNSDTIIVTELLLVADGACLTIQPGAVVRFNPVMYFYVAGELRAEGTPSERILFTATSDTAGGAPFAGQWNGLTFMEYSSGAVSYCDFRYGMSNIYVNNAEVEIYDCLSENFVLAGIYVNGTATETPKKTIIDRCTVHQVDANLIGEGRGIFVYYAAEADIYRTRIYDCQYGIEIYGVNVYVPRYAISNCDIRNNADIGIYVHPGG